MKCCLCCQIDVFSQLSYDSTVLQLGLSIELVVGQDVNMSLFVKGFGVENEGVSWPATPHALHLERVIIFEVFHKIV